MQKKALVSVLMITYGHEKFIRQAVEGVLMQECDFEVELLVVNDCSPDSTDEVLKDILENHPKSKWIKYICHKKNVGMMPNFIFALKQAKGEYIALCEGDDYWTNPYKLQKQVAFLEVNTDFVLSFHNAEVLNVISNKKHLFVDRYTSVEYSSIDIFENWLIPTASMVFRNVLEKNHPEFFIKATHGDFALQIYLNEYGKFQAINEVMSVYRINESSVTINSFSSLKHNNAHIEQLKLMNVFFNRKYELEFQRRIFLYYLRNANIYRKVNIVKPFYWVLKALLLRPSIVFYYKKQLIYSLKTIFFTFKFFLNLKK